MIYDIVLPSLFFIFDFLLLMFVLLINSELTKPAFNKTFKPKCFRPLHSFRYARKKDIFKSRILKDEYQKGYDDGFFDGRS